jgi:hypothetical protein
VGRRARPVAYDVTPSAKRLTDSLRDIGYDFQAAVADLVDNSVSAGARRIDVLIEFDGPDSRVIIADDGCGMTDAKLTEALRFGTRRSYGESDLGRYGLGLKTASISQCRRLTVVSRHAPTRRRLALRTLDLDHIRVNDRWEVIDPPSHSACYRALEWLEHGVGTVVIWELLDRVLPDRRQESGWAKRRLEHFTDKTSAYLGMVFHRFIEGEVGSERVTISVNGEKVIPWNPFAPGEEHRLGLPEKVFELAVGGVNGHVRFRPFVLPPRSRFTSLGEFERLSGPLKWNRQQGLYIYRAGRLIQSGGWCGIRAADEHTKFARAAIDFGTELDMLFHINVSKMRVSLPAELRTLAERPIHELCHKADSVYRRESLREARRAVRAPMEPVDQATQPPSRRTGEAGAALMAAALEVGEHAALERIMNRLQERAPELASALGW